MNPITMALLGGTSLVSGGLGYLGSQQAGRAQQQAAQTSGLFGLIAQQQAQQQAKEAAEKGAAAASDYYGRGRQDIQDYYSRGANALREFYGQGREDLLGQAALGEAAGREFYGQGVGFQEPYMTAGAGATNRLAALFAPGGEYTRQPTLEELQMDPGYAFRTREGERAMMALQGASGLRGSGAALKAGIRYGQEAGSQEYQSAYNRFMANRAAATQGLQNLAGTGAGAAGTATGLAGQVGTNLMGQRFGAGSNLGSMAGTTGANLSGIASTAGSNLGTMASNAGATTAGAYTGAIPTMAALTSANPYGTAMENVGQARASSYMGGAGALGQALNTIPQNYMTYSILNRMQPQMASAAPAGYVRYNPGVNQGPQFP